MSKSFRPTKKISEEFSKYQPQIGDMIMIHVPFMKGRPEQRYFGILKMLDYFDKPPTVDKNYCMIDWLFMEENGVLQQPHGMRKLYVLEDVLVWREAYLKYFKELFNEKSKT